MAVALAPPAGAGDVPFGAQQVISTAAESPRSVFAADVDGDGDLDVLSASYDDGKVAWYENTDGAGSFGTQQIISTYTPTDQLYSVFAADVDGDGDLDALSACGWGGDDANIAWYLNTDGAGSFGTQQIISAGHSVRSVFPADVDGDGDLDVLSASYNDEIAWYENTARRRTGPARSSPRTWMAMETWMSFRPRVTTTRSPGTRTRTGRAASGPSR
jgi:hypothetical protein